MICSLWAQWISSQANRPCHRRFPFGQVRSFLHPSGARPVAVRWTPFLVYSANFWLPRSDASCWLRQSCVSVVSCADSEAGSRRGLRAGTWDNIGTVAEVIKSNALEFAVRRSDNHNSDCRPHNDVGLHQQFWFMHSKFISTAKTLKSTSITNTRSTRLCYWG